MVPKMASSSWTGSNNAHRGILTQHVLMTHKAWQCVYTHRKWVTIVQWTLNTRFENLGVDLCSQIELIAMKFTNR